LALIETVYIYLYILINLTQKTVQIPFIKKQVLLTLGRKKLQ
jgi:hypothetical protein